MEAAQTNPVQIPPSKKKNSLLITGLLVIIFLVVASALWWVFVRSDNEDNTQKQTTKVATQSASKSSTSSAETNNTSSGSDKSSEKEASDKMYPVKVYFSKNPESANDPTKVFAVSRNSPDKGVAKYSLGQLIAGPTASEKSAGYYTEIKLSGTSNCNSEDFVITIESGKATVRFCKTFMQAGVMSDARVQTQIETTLLQFSTVESVVLLNKDGYCLFDASGANACNV